MINQAFRDGLGHSRIPGGLHDELIRWVEEGVLPSSNFILALISNDLVGAASSKNYSSRIREIVEDLDRIAPSKAFFRTDALSNWSFYIQALNRQETGK